MNSTRFTTLCLGLLAASSSLAHAGQTESAPRPRSSKPRPAAKPNAALNKPLAAAIEAKDAAKVAALLKRGANANGRAEGGHTFLMLAINNQAPAITALLLEAGANPKVSGIPSGETPLFMAALLGQDEIVEQLLEKGIDVNDAVPQSGLTPLHATVYGSKPETARKLLEAGADVTVRAKSGKTALEVAEQLDNAEMIDLLREAEQKETP